MLNLDKRDVTGMELKRMSEKMERYDLLILKELRNPKW
jgi:hypothetical protein